MHLLQEISTLTAYFAAIQDFFKYQKNTLRTNSNTDPNTLDIQKFKKAYESQQLKIIVQSDLDRGKNTILDGYATKNEIEKMASVGMLDNTSDGLRRRVKSFLT